jgi:ferrochelatase
MNKLGLLLIQLGSPKSPKVEDVKSFLKDFLGDPRVVDNQSLLWKIVLNLFVLPNRSPKSAEAYSAIWDGQTFPLFKNTESFAKKLQESIDDYSLILAHSYILSSPSVTEQIKHLKDQGCKTIRVIPMFPQYCEATTLSCRDAVDKALTEVSGIDIAFVESFHTAPAYINNSAKKINDAIKEKNVEKLLFSFHGYPIRRIRGGDPYLDQCLETGNLISEKVELPLEKMEITFQSRFGREPWLMPGSEETIIELAKQGLKRIAVICPAFVVDNLETEEEVGIGLKEIFLEHGGEEFIVIPCLNDDSQWVEDFATDVLLPEGPEQPNAKAKALEIPEKKCLTVQDQGCCQAKVHCETCPYKGLTKHPDGSLSPSDRNVLKTMFLTLFVDLIGFSIIFPLFPTMLDYYQSVEGPNGLFSVLMETITNITGDTNRHAILALFGGVLVFIYSFLQFLMAPVFGAISDKYGRRPLLLFSITGIAVSYALWFFSGSFLLLVISRLISGLMGSNITTATAAVADITSDKTRSKGMAIIGIAFGLGFILGPAIGGISAAVIDMSTISNWKDYGVNPFSAPALIAFIITVYNLIFVYRKFPETLAPELRGKGKLTRTINPIKLFHIESYPGVSSVVWINFIFLSAFGAAENMLTFLTYERLGYGHGENAALFVFIGFVLAMVQGGYVRRKAADIGEDVVTKKGFRILIPSLFIVALAGSLQSLTVLLIGLFLMAVGSAMIIPCLTSLVTMYTPPQEQGRVLGVYRSAGALGRTVGPILGGILYWKFRYASPYLVAGIALIFPLLLIMKLPNFRKDSTTS